MTQQPKEVPAEEYYAAVCGISVEEATDTVKRLKVEHALQAVTPMWQRELTLFVFRMAGVREAIR